MRFLRTSENGYGDSYVRSNLDSYEIWLKPTYNKWCQGLIKDPFPYEIDKRNRLELKWNFHILFTGVVIYEFHSITEFIVSEIDIAPSEGQLVELIRLSHDLLGTNFGQSRKEFSVLPSISELSPEAIDKTLPMLFEVLHSLQERKSQ